MPYRAAFTVVSLLMVVPVAFTQSATRLYVRAKCAFPDGSIVATQLIEVSPSATAEEKRAAAERACAPIMEDAYARCDDLASRVDSLRSAWRIAAPRSYHAHQLELQIKAAKASAPAYCK